MSKRTDWLRHPEPLIPPQSGRGLLVRGRFPIEPQNSSFAGIVQPSLDNSKAGGRTTPNACVRLAKPVPGDPVVEENGRAPRPVDSPRSPGRLFQPWIVNAHAPPQLLPRLPAPPQFNNPTMDL